MYMDSSKGFLEGLKDSSKDSYCFLLFFKGFLSIFRDSVKESSGTLAALVAI